MEEWEDPCRIEAQLWLENHNVVYTLLFGLIAALSLLVTLPFEFYRWVKHE